MASRSWPRLLPAAGLLAATTMVILLGREVRSLRADARLASEREQYMLAGMYIPRLELSALDGQRVAIGETPVGTREVLFVFDTSCGFCRSTLPSWNVIAAEGDRGGSKVYGLSLDELGATSRYVEANGFKFSTLLLDNERAKALLRARAVPQTLVVDSGGLVLLARPGVLTQLAIDSVLALVRGDHKVSRIDGLPPSPPDVSQHKGGVP